MRRRLWCQICSLDRQASGDRGSDPIITTNSFSTQSPLHINDEDLIPNDPQDIQPRDEYTDITLSLVCHEVFEIERRLNYILPGESDRSQERPAEDWAHRTDWVTQCQQRIKDKYLRLCNMNVPIQRYTVLVANVMIANMWLWTYRPLQKRRGSPSLVAIPQSWILYVSLEVIEKSIQMSVDSSCKSFRWIVTIWVQWHALAVLITELCLQTKGPLVERAWTAVNTVFEETARHVADSNKGRLWRPIKKLMNKAQLVRKKHLEDTASTSASFDPGEPLRVANEQFPPPNTQVLDLGALELEARPRPLNDTPGPAQHLQQSIEITEPIIADWDPWVATEPSDQTHYDNDLNQIAWTNWESFVDDFQASGDGLSGRENGIPPLFTTW